MGTFRFLTLYLLASVCVGADTAAAQNWPAAKPP
jgi:hypothetical protein